MAKKKSERVIIGDHDVGYGRPPKSGQIKQGEVRNPWGRTGKRERAQDLLLKIAEEKIQATVNGRPSSMTQEEAAYRKVFQDAMRLPSRKRRRHDAMNYQRRSLTG